MRPVPPPDTPNTGRERQHLVSTPARAQKPEPAPEPQSKSRAYALAGGIGAAVVIAADAVARIFT